MGSGKTTFGKKLAARIKMEFADLDQIISHECNHKDVSELIAQKGFIFFREFERDCLQSTEGNDRVIATGGGTPCFFDNISWMKNHGIVVFLNPGTEVIYSRLKSSDLSKRPLLQNLNGEELLEFIRNKMEERLPFYLQADVVFNPVKEETDALMQAIGQLMKG